ncbi:MAG: molybdopterin dinucleotide binding domain-containing protein, partial [Acidimicrobiales bacterium]
APISGPVDIGAPRVPITDSYSHRLVAGRRLYDDGAAVQAVPSLAGLVGVAPLRGNPHDLDDLGLSAGGRVRVKTARASAVLEVAPDPALPRGVVAVDFNVPLAEGTAGDLIDSSMPVTELRMETP